MNLAEVSPKPCRKRPTRFYGNHWRRSFSENLAGGVDGALQQSGVPVEDPGGFRRSAAAACNADGLEAGQAFAVVLKSGRDVEGRYAVVQAAARWCTPTGMWVMRVRPPAHF